MKQIFYITNLILALTAQDILGNETVMNCFGHVYVEDKKNNSEFLVLNSSGNCNHLLRFNHLTIETQFDQPPEFNNTLVVSHRPKPISQTITLHRINRSFNTKDIAYNISKNGKAWGFEYEVDLDYPIKDGDETLKIKAISVVIGQDVEGIPVAEYYLWPNRLSSNPS